MNAKRLQRLQKYQQWLYSWMPLIAERRWREAAQALAQDSSPYAVRVLAEAVARHHDERARQVMIEALRQLVDQRCIDTVCAVWAATRHASLAALLAERGWVASAPAEVKVLSALLVGQWEEVTAGGREVVEPLVQACEDAHPTIAARARQALHNLQNSEAQETLCRMVLDSDQPTAREVARAAQYAPQELQQRALFYFLTEQWDKYENVDFDQTLLRAVYEVGDTRLRQRVAETARRAGRVEWIEVVTGGRQRRRLGEMTDGEWEATLAVLTAQKQGEAMWRLAQVAPPVWSVRLLYQLADMAWMPQAEQERASFVELRRLAAMFVGKTPELHRFVHSLSTLEGHRGWVKRLAMSPDGRVVASAGTDWTVRLWSVPDGKALHTLTGHTATVASLAMSSDGRVLASGDDHATVRLWSVPDGKALHTLTGHSHTAQVYLLAMSSDGRVLASGDNYATVRLWSVPDGKALHTLRGFVCSLAMSPDGRVVASGTDRTVQLWSVPDGKALRTLTGHTDYVYRLAMSSDGRVLASGGTDRTVRLWSVPDGKALHTLTGRTGEINCVAMSADGRVLASGTDRAVQLWSVPDGKALHTLTGHTGRVRCVAISSDGRVVASGGDHTTVRLWSVPDGKALHTLTGHTARVACLAMSADGRVLASSGDDGTVRLWSVEPLRLSYLPLDHMSVEDVALVQQRLQSGEAAEAERGWLEFLLAMMRWRRRFDIGVGEAPKRMEVGEFDIEIEG